LHDCVCILDKMNGCSYSMIYVLNI
jgi:hypothetical protein